MSTPDSIVLVLTIDQCAALCVAATGGLLTGAVPPQFLADVSEAVFAINEAIGNPPTSPESREMVLHVREIYKR